jgi:beta-glucosidase
MRRNMRRFSHMEVRMNIQVVLSQLSTEDKIRLCSGKDFWHLESYPELGIPEIMVSDGPHGLRKQVGDSDQLGISDSYPSVCFPTASLSACSWDKELMYKMGQILGEEAIDQKVSVILGPGINIKRNPLCGRNFEYFSEDPLLSAHLASKMIQGIQSQGIGTSLKHFAGNNQESDRMTGSSNIDQRALFEIYLRPFELAIKQSQPWTVMCSYNKINGVHSSSNPWLLNQVLRDTWGFKGLVMSDWGAAHERAIDIKAGLDLEMPGNHHFYLTQVNKALDEGSLKKEDLDICALRVLDLINKSLPALRRKVTIDEEAHRAFARKVAQESIVLLKNNDHILPIKENKSILVLGELAQIPRIQGSGSSQVHPIKVESFIHGLQQAKIPYQYEKAYNILNSDDFSLIDPATKNILPNQEVIVFVGLTEELESEGFDRLTMALPRSHDQLIETVLKKTSNVIIILAGGSAVEMPWASQVKAIVNGYLPGEAGGLALVDVITGKINPSGKLAETYPIHYEDCPSSDHFGYEQKQVNYRESIFVGYRYYDSAKKEVLFPFGHGLSYTSFSYRDLSYVENVLSFTLTNTGELGGSEVVEIYVSNLTKANFFASHELKAFEKIYLKAKESKVIHLSLDESAFQYYDTSYQRFITADGEYEIQVGSSSQDLRLSKRITLKANGFQHIEKAWHNTWYDKLEGKPSDTDFEFVYEKEIPVDQALKKGEFSIDASLNDMRSTLAGKMMRMVSKNMLMKAGHYSPSDTQSNQFKMMMSFVMTTPLRSTMLLSQGALSESMAHAIVDLANGHYIKGLKGLLRKKHVS